MKLENKINKAWDSLVSGDIESSYKALRGGGRLSIWQKELVRQVKFLRSYNYPELEMAGDNIRNEFALVASWNFLLSKNLLYDTVQWSKIDILAPLLGNTFKFTVDINAIRIFVGHQTPIYSLITPTQYYEQLPQLLSLSNLSLGTRNLFIRIIKYAQIRLGGLVEARVVDRLDSHQTKQGLVDLSNLALIQTGLEIDDLLPDLMMTKTMKDIKKFGFDHSLDLHGTKHQ